MNEALSNRLMNSNDPSVRYIFMRDCYGGNSADLALSRRNIQNSPKVQEMLAARQEDGKFPWRAYDKWRGAFWTFLLLADLGYPEGDHELDPLKEQIFEWLLDENRLKKVPLINDRWRRCALQESGAIFSMLRLGLNDARLDRLADLLLKWQWPDGGWNCDKKPAASHSSFYESLIPLRGMNAYARSTGDLRVSAAADRAAEMFLSRRLFHRLGNGEIIREEFCQLAFPPYWHYDILTALTAMDEAGRLSDPRCSEALDLLESKRLPDGGFAAEVKYYKVTQQSISGVSPVDWGPVSQAKMNEHITVRALGVLSHAGRITIPINA